MGAGRWGRLILRDLRRLGCEVVVVRPPSLSDQQPLPSDVGTVGELIECDGVEGVVIATPATTHYSITLEALKLGVPVAVEKPLTIDTKHAKEIAAIGTGRLFVLHKWVYHPGVMALRHVVREQVLGRVCGLRTTRTQSAVDCADVDAVWTLAPHDLSIVHAVLGSIPIPRSACGVAAPRGGLASIVGILGEDPWAVVEVGSGFPGPASRQIVLHASHGVARLPSAEASSLEIFRHDGRRQDVVLPRTEPLLDELQVFRDHILGGPPPPTGVDGGVAVVEALTELRRLAQARG